MKIIIALCLCLGIGFAQSKAIIKVERMHCPLCTTAVKKALKHLDGIDEVHVKLNTKMVTLTYDETKLTQSDILRAIKTTSYEGVFISTQKIPE